MLRNTYTCISLHVAAGEHYQIRRVTANPPAYTSAVLVSSTVQYTGCAFCSSVRVGNT